MNGGLFITLYDEETLKLYLNRGIYGFLMKPVLEDKPSSHSTHYKALADYACSREGTDLFFFLKRKIIYGGKIFGNSDSASFYLNGRTSPLGRKLNANLFWDESKREKYKATDVEGVFYVGENKKSQPFIFQFKSTKNTGKYIFSDELYFKLGEYGYPLPSNSIQGMSFCTLTPGEVETINSLIDLSDSIIDYSVCEDINKNGEEVLFNKNNININDELINEAQLEFTILASLEPFKDFLSDNYVLCRQVPISPFKPMDMDKADICLYSINVPIKKGTIPNVVIELKRECIDHNAYNQIVRYMKWLEKISGTDFDKITAYAISKTIKPMRKSKIDLCYKDKIKMFSINNMRFEENFIDG